ncbi:hypothetical protein H6A61_13390 [Bacteroides caecigallinarum]|uniref:hypothetical protein n=1 Tax=Bacteroides caecigallinarum TaxID=1411144 RepID=UPI00195890B2|nr:hypothetical protein [Bacteroides caecigallinarum]MBM6961836.1 hypothetical protein [Bacteroides caecigallinarum]
MKKISFILSVVLASLLVVSCGSSKKAANKMSIGTEIEMPLSGKEYQSNSEYWRYTSEGVSPQMSVAKEIAVQSAREHLAATVQSNVEMVVDRYAKNFNIGDKADLTQLYERRALTAVSQTLKGSEVIGEKMFRLENGNYKCFVCMQLSKQSVKDEILSNFEQDEKIKTELDREEFKKVFDSEIEKLK